jgi:hypothetical protein
MVIHQPLFLYFSNTFCGQENKLFLHERVDDVTESDFGDVVTGFDGSQTKPRTKEEQEANVIACTLKCSSVALAYGHLRLLVKLR